MLALLWLHVSLLTRRYRQISAVHTCIEPRSLTAARHARFLILAGARFFALPRESEATMTIDHQR